MPQSRLSVQNLLSLAGSIQWCSNGILPCLNNTTMQMHKSKWQRHENVRRHQFFRIESYFKNRRYRLYSLLPPDTTYRLIALDSFRMNLYVLRNCADFETMWLTGCRNVRALLYQWSRSSLKANPLKLREGHGHWRSSKVITAATLTFFYQLLNPFRHSVYAWIDFNEISWINNVPTSKLGHYSR